jgi:hypothetical protein
VAGYTSSMKTLGGSRFKVLNRTVAAACRTAKVPEMNREERKNREAEYVDP